MTDGLRDLDQFCQPTFSNGRRNINLLFSELDLNESPSSIMQANDRIRFQSRLIPIMEHISAKRISIHTQIANTHGLKQQAKGLEIIKESLRGSRAVPHKLSTGR